MKKLLLMGVVASFGLMSLSSCGESEKAVVKDAKRMAELGCEAAANNEKARQEGLGVEEMSEINSALEAEIMEISKRFEENYAGTEDETTFQEIYIEGLKACQDTP